MVELRRGYGAGVSAEAKRFEYAVDVDRAGRVAVATHEPLQLADEWTPDHLLLAALARCTIESAAYHARRSGADLVASASASGVVTKREEDGRYAFVEIECALDVEVEPTPSRDDLDALLAKAERDCFVGASLTVAPAYRWRVNGAEIAR